VFEWNPASARVLEKNGYAFEGRLRRSVFKDGVLGDTLVYARLRDD
jgi:RimJ/RimL family protein N-acetyltransferase